MGGDGGAGAEAFATCWRSANGPQLDGLADDKAEAEIGWVIDLVTAIRSIRAEMNITAAIPLVLAGASAETKGRAERWAEFIKRLARVSEISSAASAPQGSVQLVVRGEVAALPLKGVIDLAAERARLAKEMQKADADIARCDAKLEQSEFRGTRAGRGGRGGKRKARGGGRAQGEDRGGAGAAQGRGIVPPRAGEGGEADRDNSRYPPVAVAAPVRRDRTKAIMMTPTIARAGRLILTAKSANKIQFFDAATLAKTGEIDMPASTHEMIRSPDGDKIYASVYGGGIFGKNKDPDRRIAVIDLASKSLERTIDVGDNLAPHSVMMDARGTLWSTAELGNAVLAIDPATNKVERIDVGGSPHWIAVSHPIGKLFASFKTKEAVAVVDTERRAASSARLRFRTAPKASRFRPTARRCSSARTGRAWCMSFDTRTHELRHTLAIDGAPGEANQLRRVRVSPDGRYVCASSHVDNFAAIYKADTLEQVGGFATPKAPMGFGFAADGMHAYLCCHDAAITMEFELRNGRVTRQFETAAGCEFVISY